MASALAFVKNISIPRPSFSGVVEHVRSFASLRSFVWSFGLLIVLAFLLTFQSGQFSPSGEENDFHEIPESLTGKVMATLDLEQHADIPIQYGEENLTGSALNHEDISPTEQNIEIPDQFLDQKTERQDGLFEDTPFGSVPIRSKSDDKTVFDAYQIPYIPLAGARGVIALVMVDYGLSEHMSKASIISLPPYVTFVTSPYSREIQDKIDLARAASHEIWLDTPIQSKNFGLDDTGPLTLLSGLNDEQNHTRLLHILSLAHGYVGISFLNSPAFQGADKGLENIFSIIEQRGLGLASSDLEDGLSAVFANRHTKIPFAKNQLWIDANQGNIEVEKTLKQLEQKALNNYVAIAFIKPQPKLFPVIKEWEKTLSQQSLQLVPLSAAIKHSK